MRIQFGAEALQLNPAGLPMNPKHYKLVDELYNDEKKSFELGRIHLFYKELYETGRANKEFYFASFWRMRPLTELLQTEAIIGKFYMAQPFSQFVNVTAKATFVYSYWLAEAEKYQHYDVERLYWKFGDNKSHDLLKALKAFSLTSTRFNFTEPLNHLCIRAI